MEKEMEKKVREVLVNLTVLAVTVILFLLALEAAIRVIVPGQIQGWPKDLFIPDDKLGYKLAGNFTGRMFSPEYNVGILMDERGFRTSNEVLESKNEESKLEKRIKTSKAPKKILVLGDSFLFGWGVEFNESYAGILEGLVKSNGYEVIAEGIPGYGQTQEKFLLERDITNIKPDVIIVFFNIDTDLWDNYNFNASTYYFYNGRMLRTKPSLTKKLGLLFYDNSAAYNYFGRIFFYSDFGRKLRGKGQEASSILSVLKKNLTDKEWQTTLEDFDRINAIAKANGARVVIVFVPSKLQVYPEILQNAIQTYSLSQNYDPELPQAILKEYSRKKEIVFVDFTGQLWNSTENYFKYDGHWTASGHRIAAEESFKTFINSGLI